MRERTVWTLTLTMTLWSAVCLVPLNGTRCYAQHLFAQRSSHDVSAAAAQPDSEAGAASTSAGASGGSHAGRLIVIGFVGGFVKSGDARHPEVQLATELRRRYSSGVYAQVFGNHQREAAHRQVLHWLDTDGDGVLTDAEKQRARIIIYGHSWGASETIALAHELEHRHIPVLLTIQVDCVGKPGEHDGLIPPNVANAVNFYQPDGLFHGRSEIAAADPSRTRILGNFRMTYSNEPIASGSSSWFARLFMKSHLQIEGDPHIWQRAAELIDEQFAANRNRSRASAQ